ncbi:hypothetical protein L6164_005751 [Bauhinia variegata]|uniref:Uncharacterized protein n=1 Tax=Bauhinia variegata TaxID=167791 RepID=A0ACB9PSA8_BAUVA|nr:hypothetical protein L6164_005751 [Bauhinia variegata]
MILSYLGRFPWHLKAPLFEEYSKLLDLLNIEVQRLALLMGMYYWDPSYRCFTFNDIDLTPTLEKYGHMLGMPMKKQSSVYTYSKSRIAMKHISNLFGISEEELAKEGAKMNGETCIWPMTRGCISYSPMMVLQQYKMRQFIPPTKRLVEVEFFYKDHPDPELVNLYRQAWRHILIHDVKFCSVSMKIEEDYEEWFRNRGKNLLVPEATHPYFPLLPKETIQNFEVEQELRSKLEQAEDKLLKYERKVKSLKEELDKVNGQLHNKGTGERMDDLKKKNLAGQVRLAVIKENMKG